MSEDGEMLYKTPTGATAETVLMSGSDVDSAEAQIYQNPDTGATEYVVALKLTETGSEKFAAATEEYLNETISIWMDDVMISAPTVQSTITGGERRSPVLTRRKPRFWRVRSTRVLCRSS